MYPQQTRQGLSWERSRMDRLVTQYAHGQLVPGEERPLDAELVSRLWLCIRAEGYGLSDEEERDGED
jgi:hypothetical protein